MPKNFSDLPVPVQAMILILIPVLLAAGVFFGIPGIMDGYVWPLAAKRDALDRQVKSLKAENDRNEAFRQQQTEYLNRIAQLEKQLETLRSIVPDEQATDVFMKMIFDAGSSNGVNVRTFIPKPPVERELYVELPFAVRLDGTYYSLRDFFNRLAHEQRIVTVTGLALGAPEGGGMGNYSLRPGETVGANCMVTTFYNRPVAPIPGAQARK